jgi:hypothetical protein
MKKIVRSGFIHIFLITVLVIFLSPIFSNSYGQVDWTKYSGNPVLLPGAPGTWDDVGFPNATVLIIGSTYHMWYSGNDGTNMRIGHATSPDGINWTKDPTNPVLNLGAPGSWDDYWVYFPAVVYDGVAYHMWYTGDDGPPAQNENIGHATSPNGINWTKDPMNPVMMSGTSGSWDGLGVGGGFASIEGSTFHLWYDGGDGTAIRSGHATSTDGGTTWVKDPSNPILNVGSPSSWDYPRAQVGSIIYNQHTATYYMFYCGGDFFTWKIGYATASSINGPWSKSTNNPTFTTTLSSWDSYYVSFPCIIYDTISGNYKMWYAGNNVPGGGKIGLATSLTVPVEFISFIASANGNEVKLSWSTATELNNQGFEVQRKFGSNDFVTIGSVKGKGTTTSLNNYSYTDKLIDPGKYLYRLKQVDFNGTFEYSNVIEVDVRSVDKFALELNYPNPFNPSTKISWQSPVNGRQVLKVFDVLGNEIATLVNEEKEAGYHSIDFNGSNLPSGIYFYQLRSGSFIQTKQMLLLK